jgi:hypothetical protein
MEPTRRSVPGVVLAAVLGTVACPEAATAASAATTVAAEREYRFAKSPSGRTQGLQGVYQREVPPADPASGEAAGELWFFTREGRFSRSPKGGYNLDRLAAALSARGTEGVYWMEGDRLVLAMAGGSVLSDLSFAQPQVEHVIGPIGSSPSAPRVTLERKQAPGFLIGGFKTLPVRGVSAGTRFDAGYAQVSGAREHRWVFHADGRFSRESTAAAATSGTYTFSEHTLTLTFATGATEALTVAAEGEIDAAGRPEALWCEGTRLRRNGG